MLDLTDSKQMQEFCNNIAAAKLIADEVGDNPTYEKITGIADQLDISVEEVQGYLQLFKYIQNQMIL